MTMNWQNVEIAGKSADVLNPADGAPIRFALIYLHTYNMESLASNAVITALLRNLNVPCICPQGNRCWWADRICPEFDPTTSPARYLLDAVAPFAQQRWDLGPRGLGLFGINMGGQGALKLAFQHPKLFPVVAVIAPSLEYHELYWDGTPIDEMYTSKEQCRQDTAIMHIHPSEWPPHIYFCIDPTDPWRRGCDRLHEKLGALGIPHQHNLATRAGGHTWDYFNRMAEPALTFAVAGLERESRRLL